MGKSSGITIIADKRDERGRRLEGVEVDVVYEATAAQFAWWFCELAIPDFDKKDIKTWKNWGTIATSSVDPAFRLRCIGYLREKGLIPAEIKTKDSKIKSKVASDINEALGR